MERTGKKISLPIGSMDFTAIRQGGRYYIDKSAYIGDIIRDDAYAILFTRPRRFGKTTFQTMLAAFFDIRKDNGKLFEGLAIMTDHEATSEWMGKWPVIHLTLKDVDALDFPTALDLIGDSLSVLFTGYADVFQSTLVTEKDRALALRIMTGECTLSDICLSLKVLARCLNSYYDKRVILLVDEYDVPLAKANANGYYDEMLAVMRSLLSVIKDNPNLERTVLTGCLRVSKESIFTGINNLASYTLTRREYAGAFGFTDREVSNLLSDAGLEGALDQIRSWYDGYRVGKESIFSSWDVMQHVSALMKDPLAKPLNYWANSGSDDDITRLIDRTRATISDEYTALVNGGVVYKKINGNLTYNTIYKSADNIWSLLFETGYLTLAGDYDENGPTALRLPNEEVRNIFADAASRWFEKTVMDSDRTPLFDALWAGDDKTLSLLISRYLAQAISFFDYGEAFYHAFLLGLLASPQRYDVKSNRESGTGRPDVLVIDNEKSRCALFELKVAQDFPDMEAKALEALAQADARAYGDDLAGFTVTVYGLSFWHKKALVRVR